MLEKLSSTKQYIHIRRNEVIVEHNFIYFYIVVPCYA